ncbi:MAG: redoxin family protein, partial [Bryobacteraceae bacterium]
VEQLRAGARAESRDSVQLEEESAQALARSLVLQARAMGNLGKMTEAIDLARKSYAAYPTAESAREIGRWLARTGREEEAIPHYADAFTIDDPRNTEADRAKDRAVLGKLYTKLKGDEKGLGDLVLEAYDRTTALSASIRERQRAQDPNAKLTDFMEFTLTGLEGDKLELTSLKGKVIVMDFWATWCGPCRVQHPLYEEVKKRFADDENVVFLAINTEDDPAMVEQFLEKNQWSKKVYFESGLSQLLKIASIPTTIIVGRDGQVFSRMNGFVPERFVDMLTERIKEALAPPPPLALPKAQV